MSARRFQSVLIVLFLLVFQAEWSFAVVADANIISQLRQMKTEKLAALKTEYNEIPQKIRQCRFATIVPENNKSSSHNQNSLKYQNRRRPKITFRSYEEKMQKLQELNKKQDKLEQNISAIEANDISAILPYFTLPFKLNQFGQYGLYETGNDVYKQAMHVLTIIDESNMLVKYKVRYYTKIITGSAPRESQTLVGYLPTPEIVPVSEIIWLRGVSTEGLVTKDRVTPPSYLIITGTQDYLNSDGTKQTVYVFEPLVIDPNDL